MHWRAKEFSEMLVGVEWLTEEEANFFYDRVESFLSRDRYGLNVTAVRDWQSFRADAAATGRLSSCVTREGILLLIFEPREACRIPAAAFHDHWRDLFCPSRDDVIVTAEAVGWILFYSHEDEFEYGRRAV